jgi:hypothetical protein
MDAQMNIDVLFHILMGLFVISQIIIFLSYRMSILQSPFSQYIILSTIKVCNVCETFTILAYSMKFSLWMEDRNNQVIG